MQRRKSKMKPFKRVNPDEKDHSAYPAEFTGDFAKDLEHLKQEIGQNSDIRFREFNIGHSSTRAAIIFIDGLCDRQLIDKHIMRSLMHDFSEERMLLGDHSGEKISLEYLKNNVLPISELIEANTIKETVQEILIGNAMLLLEGSDEVLIIFTAKGKTRSIEEPVSEQSVRGPRAGFNESISDNSALLRRNGRNEKLVFSKFQVGKRTKKDLIVAYIEDIANPDIVNEVKSRVEKIDIDNVLESGYVEQLIEDNFLSPFPQVQNTERPDRVMAALMEGRVAILLDGTPFALIVPVTFSMLLQASEDYYERWIPGTLIRLLRFLATFISLFGPALYIAFVSFHQGLIPTKLAMSIMGTRDGVPFPSIIEALIMEVAIEILREAGLRLPKPIGPAIGIVGALIIGEAAVQAGIVSPIMVIVVAVTAISSFAIPQYSFGISLRYLRFAAMFSAAVYGLYGVILFFLFLCSHLVKLKSFGVSYVSGAVPYRLSDWKDFIIRMSLNTMKRRPSMLHTKDPNRKG
ncbi:spore germination protein [Bacillus sp. J33]|uniref:spore germination protein n=1 Tax=Bacillus sp. J33 TaxID=935836 RepID=UPI00047B12B2